MARNNVVDLNCITRLDIPAERIIVAASIAGLSHVVIIGELPDGSEYFGSSRSDGPEILWAIERAKMRLLRIVDEDL